jgi:tetratricopeptide (TPR) repeat protein
MIGNSRNTQTLMASMKGQMDWQPAEFFYFAEAKSSRLSALAQSVLGDEFEVNRAEYAEAVIRFAWLLDTERGYRAAIENLSDRDECDAAHELLEKHAFNTLKDGSYLIGKCYYFSDSFGSALSHFKKQWTETRLPKTPIYIARTLIKQGEFLLALEWLEIAKQVTPADSRVSFYKGQAYLGVGDLDSARRAFRKGANDPSSRRHNRARRELLRLETAVE